jgi:hypothetical protein
MVKLADYVHDDRFFEFDPETGRFESVRLAAPIADCKGCCGMAQLLRVKRQDILVATYCQDGQAWLSIGAQRWPLHAPDLEMKHEEIYWGFTCRFSIRRADELLFRFEYPRQDRLLLIIDSTYDYLDFSLAHLLADVGDYGLWSREQHLAWFMKRWCPESTAPLGAPADAPPRAVARG